MKQFFPATQQAFNTQSYRGHDGQLHDTPRTLTASCLQPYTVELDEHGTKWLIEPQADGAWLSLIEEVV